MKEIISVESVNRFPSNPEKVEIEIPSKCPICSVAFGNSPLSSYLVNHNSTRYDSTLFSIYFCPHCERCFLVEYSVFKRSYAVPEAEIRCEYPFSTDCSEFPDNIRSLSPKFIEIYNQAELAENAGLDEICGMGYRKSLEFLVKDFAILLNPNEKTTICSTQLSPCIKTYIDSKRIRALATASAWIGNDETHYVRKNEDYNLEHLKAFISAIVSFIDSELSYYQAEELLSASPRKKS